VLLNIQTRGRINTEEAEDARWDEERTSSSTMDGGGEGEKEVGWTKRDGSCGLGFGWCVC
jgi:hypothetical protein